MRDTTGATSAKVIDLDGDNSPSSWSEERSLGNVVTRWLLGNGTTWSTDTPATTLEDYGDRAYSATDMLTLGPAPYVNLIASDVMARPRPVVSEVSFPVRDHSQGVLYLNPLDRVVYDGVTYQVMSVQHRVTPIRLEDGKTIPQWSMTITADVTQEALAGAPEPGPVTPPTNNQQTLTFTSTKSGYAEKQSDGDFAGSGSDSALLVGKFLTNGSVYRSWVQWDITWPTNTVRVVSAKVRLTTGGESDSGRISVRRATDSTSEGSITWPGPHTHTDGERSVNVPSAGNQRLEFSVTAIVQAWFDGADNFGLRIASVNEDASARRALFWSDDAATPADRPILTVVVEVVS
jgi:hypothetical protein